MRETNIPTTDHIRWAYCTATYDENAETDFDLWLFTDRNRIAELAMAKERERIIKLLEKELDEHGFICGSGSYLFAVIKGSQNVGAEIDNPSEGENK